MAIADQAATEGVVSDEHEEVRVRRGRHSGLTVAVAVHRTVGGRSLGGCRMYTYASPDDAIRDVERLARSMTFKAAAARLSLGGAKGVISLPPGGIADPALRRAALHDFADLVDSFGGRYVTAQDVGTSLADMSYVAGFTPHVAGRPVDAGGSGDPSPYTAHGVEVAIRASLRQAADLPGAHVVVVGLGHVGASLARRLARAGARLTLSDVDASKRVLAEELCAAWVDPDDALDVEAEVLAPCALGGVLDQCAVERLRAPIVCGAANNQLAHDGIADSLRRRGIRWAPDFVANAGGLIAVSAELGGFDRYRVETAIERIGTTLQDVYQLADSAGTSTLIAARELAAERLAD
jgi:leucine dehydrogenase